MGEVHDRIVITNDTKFLGFVREFTSRMIRQSSLSREDENKIILAVDEAVANIIEHAYENQREGTIDVECQADAQKFVVTIRDSGQQFAPEGVEAPNIEGHVKAKKKKGLGIYLMRLIMDEVRYTFREGIQNELVLVKYIGGKPKTPQA
ncbi:MAG: anti-sigma regulatory factor serine/threonine protein [Planctomycetota bacterium]|nr:MAG: anti-sigma regulatory factor serine/threonine protein [Planctomycetota bacterium]